MAARGGRRRRTAIAMMAVPPKCGGQSKGTARKVRMVRLQLLPILLPLVLRRELAWQTAGLLCQLRL